jgi:hypothetical protein
MPIRGTLSAGVLVALVGCHFVSPSAREPKIARCLAAVPPPLIPDPDRDLYRVEQISNAIKRTTMDGICRALRRGRYERLAPLLSKDARLQRLFPRSERQVLRTTQTTATLVRSNGACFGDRDAFAQDLRTLVGSLRLERCFFKPFRIFATSGPRRRASADLHLWLGGSAPGGERVSEKGDVAAEFREDRDGVWRLSWLSFGERERFAARTVAFADWTERARLPTRWPDRGVSRENETLHWGPITVADFDGDGWPDIFVPRAGQSLLLRNDGHGGFEDVTARSGIGEPGFSQAAIFADFDNDGHPDLFVVNALYSTMSAPELRWHHALYRNNGDGTFSLQPVDFGSPGPASGASVADYDGDGLLDIYVTYYQDVERVAKFHPIEARNGFGNRLFRNRGGLRFQETTRTAGVAGNGWALASAWADYDGDGKIDLFVANDFGDNQLFRNRGDGSFEEVAARAGVAGPGNGMSIDWGDFDNDGHLDAYVSNMYSKTGNEMIPLYKDLGETVRAKLLKSVQGNALYRNRGNGRFEEVGRELGVNLGGWSWGANFFDYDNDGWLDIHAANGFFEGASKTDF